MMRRVGYHLGFTILEAIIATAIIVILAGAAFQLLYGVIPNFGTGEAKVQAQERARLALTNMARELREASSEHVYLRNYPAVGGSFAAGFDGTSYCGNSILFKVPCFYHLGTNQVMVIQLDDEGMVINGARDQAGNYLADSSIEYCLVSGPGGTSELRRRIWPDSAIDFTALSISGTPVEEKVLAGNADNLILKAFLNVHPNQVEITVVGRGWEPRNRLVTSYTTSEVSFRN